MTEKSRYRMSRGVAFWGVVYPLILGAFLLVGLVTALFV